MSARNDLAGLALRREAAFHLKGVLEGRPFSPIGAARLSESRDRALANRMVTVALRRHGHISKIIESVLAKGIPSRSGIFEAALRLGIAQLLYIDDIPAHSALHLAVETVRGDRRAGRFDKLINGALRSVQREADRFSDLPKRALFPAWLADKWQRQYGAAALDRLADALLEGAPLDLTLSPKADAQTRAALAGMGAAPVLASLRLFSRDAGVSGLPGYDAGHWWVQDAAAALPATFIGAQPGRRVLDLCAAPGGKTAQLCAAGAEVTALDISPERLETVKANLERLSFEADLVAADAEAFSSPEAFDAVLLDAPCSATGTFRRHPEVIWHRDEKGIAERVALQRRLLAKAASLLKPGGTLIYCVCSLEAEEAEAQMDWIADALPSLVPSPIGPDEIGGWAEPLTDKGALRLSPALAVPGAAGTLDGFFVARFNAKR